MIFNGSDVKRLVITGSAGGTELLVSASAGQQIGIMNYSFSANSPGEQAVEVELLSNTTSMTGDIYIASGTSIYHDSVWGLHETTIGQNLQLDTSEAGVVGFISYKVVKQS